MLEHAASAKGTLIIVKNYTRDKLNFGLAAERFKASTGNNVKIVLVADDVSVGRSRGILVGRRGLAGTVLIHKIAGAATERGIELEEIASLCSLVTENMGTNGVSLGPCNVPGQKALERPQHWIELGMGIHNEPAISKFPPDTMIDVVIEKMLHTILDADNKEHGYFPNDTGKEGNSVVLLMNNLGGLSVIEIGALTSMVTTQLKTRYNIVPCRTYTGAFLTALDGRGFSISLLDIDRSVEATTILLSLLDDQITANEWPGSIPASDWMLYSEPR
jgi:dihydroxyacetone kinase